jgi:hypothetical protein
VFQALFTVQVEKRVFPASFSVPKSPEKLEKSQEFPGCALFKVPLALVAFLFLD